MKYLLTTWWGILFLIVMISLCGLEFYMWWIAPCSLIKEYWFLLKNIPGRCIGA